MPKARKRTTDGSSLFTLGRRSASGDIQTDSDVNCYAAGASSMTFVKPSEAVFISENSVRLYSSWILTIETLLAKPALTKDESNQLYGTLQQVRNKIIGNRDVKALLLAQGIVSRLGQILQISNGQMDGKMAACQREAAIIAGSLIMDGDRKILEDAQSHIFNPLFDLLKDLVHDCSNFPLFEAILRTLRVLSRLPGEHRNAPFKKEYLDQMLLFVKIETGSSNKQNLCEYSASILANSCDSEIKQNLLCSSGAIPMALAMLESTSKKIQEVALDLLAAICRDNKVVSAEIAALNLPCGFQLVTFLFELCRNHHRAELRLLAAVLLTNIYRGGALSGPFAADITRVLLPALTQLLDEKGLVQVRAPLVLAFLVNGDEALQLEALGCNAVGKLASILDSYESEKMSQSTYISPAPSPRQRQLEQTCENSLIALAALASNRDECRKLVIESPVLRIAVKLLSGDVPALRAAACQCIRSLSRSVKNLRTHLVDANIVTPIVSLLDSKEDNVVRTAACATLCNMVLDFSPMKKAVLESGAMSKIAALLKERDTGLRLNAVWAIKNLLYMADAKIKLLVMEAVSFDLLYELTQDGNSDLQMQALNILRNLACGEEADIRQVIQGFGLARLSALVRDKLQSDRRDIIVQTLYIIVNIATGGDFPKEVIMRNNGLLEKLRDFIVRSKDEEIRLAAIWCVINLTWPDDDGSDIRIQSLRALGFEDALKHAIGEISLQGSIDLSDRAALALEHFTENFHH